LCKALEKIPLRLLRPIKKLLYRLSGVGETTEMDWREYAAAMLIFSGVTMTLTYLIERVQNYLSLNPQKLPAVAPDLAVNTAASFTTNTNWQAYVPETTMSYLMQMTTMVYHNFVSAAALLDPMVSSNSFQDFEKDSVPSVWRSAANRS
jgi:K+-transporting ATPase ATPase A chain